MYVFLLPLILLFPVLSVAVPSDVEFRCHSTNEMASYVIKGMLSKNAVKQGLYQENPDIWSKGKSVELTLANGKKVTQQVQLLYRLDKQTWKRVTSYKPRAKKYKGWRKFTIQQGQPGTTDLTGSAEYDYDLLVPAQSVIMKDLQKQAKKRRIFAFTSIEFDGLLRWRQDYGIDHGGQHYLKCTATARTSKL